MKFSKSIILLFSISIFMLQACDNGEYKTTESGLKYKFFKKGDGEKPEDKMIMLLNLSYYDANDSTLFSTAEQGDPVPVRYEDSVRNMGGIEEGFNMLRKGDSVHFQVLADSLYKKTFRQPMPKEITPGSMITFHIGVVDITTEEAFRAKQMEEYKKQMEAAEARRKEQLEQDIDSIATFLEKNNIKGQRTESGLFYAVERAGGSTKPAPGDSVEVHYRGTLLDGTPFDASYDRNESFKFVLGRGQVIRGWDEGIGLIGKGGKATLFIPSGLAYGEQQRGDVIMPNSILMFEVELLNFKKQASSNSGANAK